jgi:heptosyltransferase I
LHAASRILVVRLSALGDVVLAQAAVAALRRHLPDAEICWLIDRRFVRVAEQVPGVTALPVDKPRGPLAYLRLWRRLRAFRFDTVLAMQASARVNLIYAGIRAPRTIGFDRRRARDGHRWCLTEAIDRRDEHLLDGFFQFVQRLGVPAGQTVAWPRLDAPAAEAFWGGLNLRGPYVVVHTGTSKAERCWPAHRYGELAVSFSANPALPVVLTGGTSPAEQSAATAFLTECPRALNLCGKTDLDQLRVLLRHASVLVSPDTAAVHLARVEDTPVVGLYAVARPELSGAYQANHYTVNAYPEAVRRLARRDPDAVGWHFRVHHPEAMALIEARTVWSRVENALLDQARRN